VSAALVRAVDELYRRVVTEPGSWNDDAFAAWIEGVADLRPGREEARQLRRAVRAARKLARFWASGAAAPFAGEEDWRARVDLALGAPAWRPTLELARIALDAAPDPEVFAEVQARFRLVHHAPWLEGVEYAEWIATEGAGPGS